MEWTRRIILLGHLPFPDKIDVNKSFVSSGLWKLPEGHEANKSGAQWSSGRIILPMHFIVSLVS